MDQLNCNKKCSRILMPTYTATVGEGYIQSICCDYYYGTSPQINIGRGNDALVVLVNPRDSGIDLYLNKLSCANYSNSPIAVEVYTMATLGGEITQSDRIAPGNNGCDFCNGEGQIFYGDDNTISNGVQVYSRSIEAYRTSDGYPNGSIILQPGSTRAYLIKVINPNETAVASLSFAWWEEKR